MTSSNRRKGPSEVTDEPSAAVIRLAQEIQSEIARVGEQGASGQALVEAVEAVPRRERIEMARRVFDRLPAEQQWSVIEGVFDDSEVRSALEDARRSLVERARRQSAARQLVDPSRGARRVDLSRTRPDLSIAVGLFTERDVTAAVSRGHESSACARRIDLRTESSDRLRVLGDLFNPAGGYFVTRSYDEDTWRSERLQPHSVVRIGSMGGSDRRRVFEPVLFAGGRLDFETEGKLVAGRLHVGFVMVEDVDLFVEGDV
ncbi:MAG: hypothetical protein WAM97_16725 [Acidimicrobiales bacterium]